MPAEELRRLLDGAASHAVIGLDPEGRITFWGRGAERLGRAYVLTNCVIASDVEGRQELRSGLMLVVQDTDLVA